MERYDYYASVKKDVSNYIKEHYTKEALKEWKFDIDGLKEQLHDELFCNDSVTGNASGSYTCNSWQAEENLYHNFDLLQEALVQFGEDISCLGSAETCDVTIRCYLLGECISEVVDEIYED